MVSIDYFRMGLLAQMERVARGGRIDILINSGELYHSLGGYRGSSRADCAPWHTGLPERLIGVPMIDIYRIKFPKESLQGRPVL
jgi:hypothetical protein